MGDVKGCEHKFNQPPKHFGSESVWRVYCELCRHEFDVEARETCHAYDNRRSWYAVAERRLNGERRRNTPQYATYWAGVFPNGVGLRRWYVWKDDGQVATIKRDRRSGLDRRAG